MPLHGMVRSKANAPYQEELKALEHLDLIEQAFQAGKVEEAIVGDFEDVQVDLGLLAERITPARHYLPFIGDFAHSRQRNWVSEQRPTRKSTKREKAKRWQEKLSRNKNRKKKK